MTKWWMVVWLALLLLVHAVRAEETPVAPDADAAASAEPAAAPAATPDPAAAAEPAGAPAASPAPVPVPPPAPAKKSWPAPPAMNIDSAKTYLATLQTSLGEIEIELFVKDAPRTVNNFVFLAREGFYDGTIFHRIIKDFMIQGGDPEGTGMGGPGYRFDDELPVKHSYEPGIVAMANAGPNTQGSQFFICNGAGAKRLDSRPNYTQFGKVTKGMDVVLAISNVEVGPSPSGEPSKPKVPPVLQKVTITEK